MGLLRFWWLVLCRAWQEAWRIVIPKSIGGIIRDGVLLLVAVGLLIYFKSWLVENDFMSGDNIKDTTIGILFTLAAIVSIFSLVFLVEALFVGPYVLWREASNALPPISSAVEAVDASLESKETDPFLDAMSGEPHERLELFVIDYIAPAIWAKYDIKKKVLSELCANTDVLTYAESALYNSTFYGPFDVATSFGGSPLPELSNRELIDCITNLESGAYAEWCKRIDDFALEKGFDPKIHCNFRALWDEWATKHNILVVEYDKLKRESRFPKPLYRPQRPSRWGVIV